MESEVEQLSQTSNALPLPGTEAYEALPQFPKRSPLPFRRTIRRHELRQIVPLAETTIYEMERRGATVGGASLCVGGGPAMASLWTKKMD